MAAPCGSCLTAGCDSSLRIDLVDDGVEEGSSGGDEPEPAGGRDGDDEVHTRWTAQPPPRGTKASAPRRGAQSRARYPTAMASISTRTPLGSPATATVARAGGALPNRSAYTSFTFAKSPMSAR